MVQKIDGIAAFALLVAALAVFAATGCVVVRSDSQRIVEEKLQSAVRVDSETEIGVRPEKALRANLTSYPAVALLKTDNEVLRSDSPLSESCTTTGSLTFQLINDTPYELNRIEVTATFYDKDLPSLWETGEIWKKSMEELSAPPTEQYERINPFKDAVGSNPSLASEPAPFPLTFSYWRHGLNSREWMLEYYREAYWHEDASEGIRMFSKVLYWDLAEPAKLTELAIKNGDARMRGRMVRKVSGTVKPNSSRAVAVNVVLPAASQISCRLKISQAHLTSDSVGDLIARMGESWHEEVSEWQWQIGMRRSLFYGEEVTYEPH